MPLAGDLRDMALTDLIQVTCQEQKLARLIIDFEGETAEIYFDAGEIVHAQLGELTGEEAIYRVLGWEDGRFNLESDVTPPLRTVKTPWSVLLMSGLQQHDEAMWETTDMINEEKDDMANLQDLLVEMGQEVEGFMAVSVIGMDGLGIAQHVASAGLDVESVSAQMTMFVKLVQTSIKKIGAGSIEDNLLTTDDVYFMIRFLEEGNYYLGVAAARNKANLGNMRLYTRLYAKKLNDVMPS